MGRSCYANVAILMLCGVTTISAFGQDGTITNSIPILTVCDALRDPVRYGGKVVIIVGRSVGTDEGSWLSEDCGFKLEIEGRAYGTDPPYSKHLTA